MKQKRATGWNFKPSESDAAGRSGKRPPKSEEEWRMFEEHCI